MSEFADLLQPGMATVLSVTTTILISINTLFFKWLTSSFNTLKQDIKENANKYTTWLENHENKDQHRHEENLYRFEKISVALARLGSDNGTYYGTKEKDRDRNYQRRASPISGSESS